MEYVDLSNNHITDVSLCKAFTVFAQLVAMATNTCSFNVLGGGLQIERGHYSRYIFPLIVSISDTAPTGYY